jgi:hypothetical protein
MKIQQRMTPHPARYTECDPLRQRQALKGKKQGEIKKSRGQTP